MQIHVCKFQPRNSDQVFGALMRLGYFQSKLG